MPCSARTSTRVVKMSVSSSRRSVLAWYYHEGERDMLQFCGVLEAYIALDAGVENERFVAFSRHALDGSEWALGE